MLQILRAVDSELKPELKKDLLTLLHEAFEGDFSEEDWQHTFGGTRFLGFLDNNLVAHGAVVERLMRINSVEMQVGYVEGVAVSPEHWHKGFGSLLMSEITSFCKSKLIISMLSTDEHLFYSKHGWQRFDGESYVLVDEIEVRSEDEDAGLMYLLGLNEGIQAPRKAVCSSRDGDAW